MLFQNISGSQILIFNSGRLQISRHISLVGIYESNEATKLMFCQICNLTAMNIRICDPQLVNKKGFSLVVLFDIPFGCSFLQLAHKLLAVNDEAQVSAFAYHDVALHGFDGEIQFASVYLCQRGFCLDLSS